MRFTLFFYQKRPIITRSGGRTAISPPLECGWGHGWSNSLGHRVFWLQRCRPRSAGATADDYALSKAAAPIRQRLADAVGQARDEAAMLRAMVDAVPMPVWRRGADGALADCNRAYAAALGVSREEALAGGRELFVGGAGERPCDGRRIAHPAGRERGHFVIDRSRRLLKSRNAPAPPGGAVGFARDLTEIETAEAQLFGDWNLASGIRSLAELSRRLGDTPRPTKISFLITHFPQPR